MPSMHRRISLDEIKAAYEAAGSVWKAGELLGIDGRCVSSRLREVGYVPNNRPFSDQERARIAEYYATATKDTFDLDALSVEMQRPKSSICSVAKKLGLTKNGRSTAKISAAIRKSAVGRWSRKPHPRGALGLKHGPETLERLSAASRRSWATAKAFKVGLMSPEIQTARNERLLQMRHALPPQKQYTRTRGAYRADLGSVYFRSSWEANYARYLNLLKKMGVVESWEFEPETFWFDGIKRGVRSYMPDFRVFYKGDERPEYVEIKGWEQAKDRTKWKRMKKYHPSIKLVVIGAKQYSALQAKWASSIPEWEGKHGGGRQAGPRKRSAA